MTVRLNNPPTEESSLWYLDSGATRHICADRSLFSSIEDCNTTLNWGNAGSIQAKGVGTIRLRFLSTGRTATISDCLYLPQLGLNLLSLGQLINKGVSLKSDQKGSTLAIDGDVIAEGSYQGNLTYFQTTAIDQTLLAATPNIWHERMGHIGQKALIALPNKTKGCQVTGKALPICETCIQAKATTKVSREAINRATQYLETIHSDIWGPVKPLTWSKGRYFISFIDDSTRWAEVAPITSKENVYNEFINWLTREENQSGLKLKRFHSDNAKEYKSQQFRDTFQQKGVLNTYSAPYAHEQNGLAEIFNRTILSKVRAMLVQSGLSHRYWGEALMSAVYIYNRTPHSSLQGFITPYEARFGKQPDISGIRTWGSKAYKREPLEGLNKLSPRAKLGILIGYGPNQYKIADPSTHKISWVRDAYIIENEYLPSSTDQQLEEDIDQDPEPVTNLAQEPGNEIGTDTSKDEDWFRSFMNEAREYAEEFALPAIEEPNTFQQAQNSGDSQL